MISQCIILFHQRRVGLFLGKDDIHAFPALPHLNYLNWEKLKFFNHLLVGFISRLKPHIFLGSLTIGQSKYLLTFGHKQ